MKAKSTRLLGVAVSIGLLAGLSHPAFAKKAKPLAEGGPKVSTPFRDAMGQAQAATRAGGRAALAARLNAAANAAQAPDEKYYVGALRYKQADAANDRAEMRKGLYEMISSGSTLLRDKAGAAYLAGSLSFEMNDPADALRWMDEAGKMGSKEPNRFLISAESLVRLRRPAEALDMFAKAVEAANGKAPVSWYLRAMSIANAAKRPADMARWGAAMVRAEPTAENWRTAAFNYRDGAQLKGAALLDISRLVADAGALAGERDHLEFATAANANGAGGEAKAVLEAGYTNGYVNRASVAAKPLLAAATTKSAAEKAAAAATDEKRASAAADGKVALAGANAALANGGAAKAASLYKIALKKGGVDANLANTRLGIALVRSGQKAEAGKAFAAVAGDYAGVAALWAAFADQ